MAARLACFGNLSTMPKRPKQSCSVSSPKTRRTAGPLHWLPARQQTLVQPMCASLSASSPMAFEGGKEGQRDGRGVKEAPVPPRTERPPPAALAQPAAGWGAAPARSLFAPTTRVSLNGLLPRLQRSLRNATEVVWDRTDGTSKL
ncbi:hypothetical protein HPB48_001161 [Haemaphysalis longicornis]|uniref:Uncharacterized protein n=1 Tax=Haemaphysalis longicornis TaxID=44386 RepID=A0A9J6F939_HAELO|nr:hypothetical protein HPB48_001161 [Haemaphysalis longicornis]